jgi:hypothetical protein
MRSLEDERICALELRPSWYPALTVLQILAGLGQIIGGWGLDPQAPKRRSSPVVLQK